MTRTAESRPGVDDEAHDAHGVLRSKALTAYRPANGRVVSIRLIEGRDGQYCAVIGVSWRTGTYLLRQCDSDKVVRSKDLSALMQRCRKKYRFYGPIVVETENGTSQ